MSKTKSVFISGMITGLSFNTARAMFIHAESLLRCAGYTDIFNPIEHIDQNIEYEQQMELCIKEIKNRDVIYQINNWVMSKGARRECSCAISLNKEIINEKSVTDDIKNINSNNSLLDNQGR
jgi:hypothetical protein